MADRATSSLFNFHPPPARGLTFYAHTFELVISKELGLWSQTEGRLGLVGDVPHMP